MTTFRRDANTFELPWPFTGRQDELELVRQSLAAGRPGVVVTGAPGRGKTRLAAEALRGSDCARVTGTPEGRDLRFGAFAHLLPETVSLHRAVQLLSGVRLLLVDDAHLLDDASAALVHHLAVHGRTRLLVVATDGAPAPAAVTRLWTGELLPRLALEPLPREETARLLSAGAGRALEPLTADRLHRLVRGDLRLLRDLLGAIREQGALTRVPDTGEHTWRGPVPLTTAVRERAAHLLRRGCPDEREILDRLAFAEPLPLDVDALDPLILERLEEDGLIGVDDHGHVRLAHPLHGPVLRAAAGRLRARRLAGTPGERELALKTETAALEHRIEQADVRDLATPVGRWLVAEGAPLPPGHAAVRARSARLRGQLREAAAWAREGLRGDREAPPGDPDDTACRAELALAVAQTGEVTAKGAAVTDGVPAAWRAAARGDLDAAREALRDPAGDHDVYARYEAVRLGDPGEAARRLPADGVLAAHARALAHGDGPALDRAAEALEERGFLLFAAEAHAQAVRAHRDPSAARTSRTRAVALARRCPGARTPALSGLVLGELTTRQRQIVTLAAAGLTNRQIAEQLTLSVRTVGNHLYSAYSRLGTGDRGTLPTLTAEEPRTRSA